MTELMTLEVPKEVLSSAREVAARTQRRVEDVLAEWLERAAAELPLEMLSDAQILALCDLQMSDDQQTALSELLEQNRERQLTSSELRRLDELMQVYRKGLVRKAQAIQIAVQRGLRPPLNVS